jgi:uncharacterized membrane protein
MQPQKTTNGMAIASFVLGIVGLGTCSVTSILGLILGIVALSQLKKNPNETGKGLAIAGIIISSLIFLFVLCFLFLFGFAALSASLSTYSSTSSWSYTT